MAQHIVLMNVLAPFLALAIHRLMPAWSARLLMAATGVQLGLLWFWHAPFLLPQAMHSPLLQAAMQATLFAGAVWFWGAVINAAGAGAWRAIVALLVTSKLFCLLGVLLTFAPRALYSSHSHAASLEDQQLAGLLMLIACPATYLLAAVILAGRWLNSLDAKPAPYDAPA
jgi:putative membrane protein